MELTEGLNKIWSRRTGSLLVFAIFFLALLVQCLIVQWDMFHSLEPIRTLWQRPMHFVIYYIGKIVMPIFIASFVFITKRYWWTIIAFFLATIWSIANLIHYQFFDDLVELQSVRLLGNMSGAWSSLTVLWTPIITCLILLFVFFSLCVVFLEVYHRRLKVCSSRKMNVCSWLVACFIILSLVIIRNQKVYKSPVLLNERQMLDAKRENLVPILPKWMPFGVVVNTAHCSPYITNIHWKTQYVETQSIVSYFFAAVIYECFLPNHNGVIIELSKSELEQLGIYIHESNGEFQTSFIPKRSVCVLLVESLESWPIGQIFEGKEITPNLNRLVTNEHVLYCDRVKCQTRRGQSGDGQLLTCTGLLPLEDGVACMNYGHNVYPNFAHGYDASLIVNPWPNCWNQDTMTVRYGYKTLVEPRLGHKENWNDDVILNEAMSWIKHQDSLFCALVITVSTHAPFDRAWTETFSSIQRDLTPSLANYIRSLNYTDSCIGSFVEYWMSNEKLAQSVLVITGDHTISQRVYSAEIPDDVMTYAKDGFYLPFILYSPDVEHRYIHEECFQMDMFPTILSANGGGAYFWRGFGNNLLGANNSNTSSEEELFTISAKMIKSNFFNFVKNEN